MELYTLATADVSRVTSSHNCPLSYELVPVTAAPSPVALNKGAWLVEATPASYADHMGTHEYVVKACVQVEGVLANCQTSATAAILVSDPCARTMPMPHAISTTMTAGLFETSSIDLRSEFPVWPFTDTIDMNPAYSAPDSGKCGLIKYVVLDEFGDPSAFVEYDGAREIVMRPTEGNPARPGSHDVVFRAYVDDYPDNYVDVPFSVTVTACEPTIDSSNVVIPDVYHAWGADTQTLATTAAFEQYTFSPACALSFEFKAIQILPNGNTAPLPAAVKFNPDLTFSIEKCGPATFATDPTCQDEWLETTYRIVVLAKLNSLDQATDGSVEFLVTIGNDCGSDSIEFLNAGIASPQTVWLFPGEEQLVIRPEPAQFNAACPRECALTLSDPAFDEVVDSFDTADGVVRLSSANAGLDGTAFSLTIRCASTLSTGAARETEAVVVAIELWD